MALPSRLLRTHLSAIPRHPSHTAVRSLAPRLARPYHSDEHPEPPPYPPTETSILSAALNHVPAHGFTSIALTLGARDTGYLDVSTQLFPRREFELILFWLVRKRLGLKDSIPRLFPTASSPNAASRPREISLPEKIHALTWERLRQNTPIIHHLPAALAFMTSIEHLPASTKELLALSDEIVHLADDTDVSGSWYTKRAGLAGVYAASEIYMTQDKSAGFRDTERFLSDRLRGLERARNVAEDVGEWVGYTAMNTVNVLRSKGMRI